MRHVIVRRPEQSLERWTDVTRRVGKHKGRDSYFQGNRIG